MGGSRDQQVSIFMLRVKRVETFLDCLLDPDTATGCYNMFQPYLFLLVWVPEMLIDLIRLVGLRLANMAIHVFIS